MKDRPIIVIPARAGSKRLPDKLLLDAGDGRSVFQHTLRTAIRCGMKLLVATDSPAIFRQAERENVEAVLDAEPAENGTRRIARALEGSSLAKGNPLIVNLQADEVDVTPGDIQTLIDAHRIASQHASLSEVLVTTLVRDLTPPESIDRNCVKACVSECRAHWFTREERRGPNWKAHVGVYAYRRMDLLQCVEWPTEPIAGEDSLEQLTWLVRGATVRVAEVSGERLSVNSMRDLEALRARYV